MCRGKFEVPLSAWHARVFGAHIKHELHFCDAGRVETQRLIEHRRQLPSQECYMRRDEVHRQRDERGAWDGGGASSMQGESPSGS